MTRAEGGKRRRSASPNRSSQEHSLNPRKADSISVRELRVSGRIRRVGSSLALLIPTRDALKAGLSAGDPVDAVLRSGVADAFGLLKDLPYRPFERSMEGLWRDRVRPTLRYLGVAGVPSPDGRGWLE